MLVYMLLLLTGGRPSHILAQKYEKNTIILSFCYYFSVCVYRKLSLKDLVCFVVVFVVVFIVRENWGELQYTNTC